MLCSLANAMGIRRAHLSAFLVVAITLTVAADEPPISDEEAAVAAIEELGGAVRRIAANSRQREVDFRLGGRELTDEGLAHVARLENVVSLNLKGTRITSAGLAQLKGLSQLRELHLEQTEVGDEGVAHLVGLSELAYLNLYATNVSDQSLAQLTGLKKLKRLYLWQTDVSDEAVSQLEEALPELSIIRGASLEAGSTVRKRIVTDDLILPLAGEPWKLTGIRYEDAAPGPKAAGKIYYRPRGQANFAAADLVRDEDGHFAGAVPADTTVKPFEYYVRIREPKRAPSTFPPAGGKQPAEATPDASPPVLEEAPEVSNAKSYAVALKWKDATDDRGVARYGIYRSQDQASIVAKENLLAKLNPDELSYNDEQPPAGETVFYAVQPIDVAGRAGEARIVDVDVPKDMPPASALKLIASAGSNAVVLDFSGEVEPDVEQILVFRADAPDAEPKQVAALKLAESKNWIDKDVEDDVDYRYFIKLRDAGGFLSKPSGEVVAKAGGFLRRINCGGPELASPDGVVWEADTGSVSGTGRFTVKSPVAGAPEGLQEMYQSERWSYRGVRYRFDAAPGTYRATLHFAETNNAFSAKGKRTFDVLINGETLHEAVDIFANAGKATAWQLATDMEVTGDEIVIELRKVANGPAIKGIEVREVAKAAPAAGN